MRATQIVIGLLAVGQSGMASATLDPFGACSLAIRYNASNAGSDPVCIPPDLPGRCGTIDCIVRSNAAASDTTTLVDYDDWRRSFQVDQSGMFSGYASCNARVLRNVGFVAYQCDVGGWAAAVTDVYCGCNLGAACYPGLFTNDSTLQFSLTIDTPCVLLMTLSEGTAGDAARRVHSSLAVNDQVIDRIDIEAAANVDPRIQRDLSNRIIVHESTIVSMSWSHASTGEGGGYYSPIPFAADSWSLTLEARPYCIGDFNGDGGIDGSDVSEFFAAWESGVRFADVDENGGVDQDDVAVFFARWENGECR